MSFKKNTAVTGFTFGLVSATDGSDITTGTPVGYYTLDGGTQTAIGDVTPVHEGNGQWSFDLLAAEMNGDVVGLVFTHASAITAHFTIKTTTVLVSDLNDISTAQVNTECDTAITDAALATAASLSVVDGIVDTILVDTADLQANQGNWLTATGFAVSGDAMTLTAAGVDLIWDESLAAHQTALTAGRATTLGGVAIAETVASGTPTTTEIILTAGSAVDNFYRDSTLRILGGAGAGQARIVTSYTGSTKTCTFDEAFAVSASNGDAVAIAIDHVHPVTEIVAAIDANSAQLAAIVLDTGTTIPAQIAGLNDVAATDIVSAGAITTLAGAVVNVDLVDTCTTNTDMRGTNSAATAASLATAQADLDIITGATGVNLLAATQASIDAIEVDTSTTIPGTITTLQSGVTSIKEVTDLGVRGATIAGTLSTTQMTTDLTEVTDGHYIGRLVTFTTGVLIGQQTDITGYTGTTKLVTFTTTTDAPGAGDDFIIS